jgi:two-component system, cell cycle sensor histidine kinase and response regulator CckA
MHRCGIRNTGRSKVGFFPGAVLFVLLTGLRLFGAEAVASVAPPFYQKASFYWLAVLISAAVVVSAWRLAVRWRRRMLKQRDEEIFGLVDQWTKSLRQEVAERKQAQRALLESQQFIMRQERLAAVGQLAAGLAHEFNNILTVVQGHAFLLMNNPNLDEESLKSLNHINEGVERTSRLVKQMLALSRKQVMLRKPLDMKEILGQTAEMLGRTLSEQVVLKFEIAPRLPPILADAEMFQQIILNLVVNARDAMSSGGQLTIRANEAKFSPNELSGKSDRKPGQFVRLSVADTGSGMDTAIINHLFEPFFTTKDVGKGTGLGLATVHGMVNQHQGWIEVESQIGKGTCFDIYFPVADQPAETPFRPAEAAEIPGGKETILVVEVQEALRQLVREVLQNHGYQILEAPDARLAVQLWENSSEKIDLALIDISALQAKAGRDAAARFWRDNSRLPVIFITDYGDESAETREKSGPFISHLPKPYGPAQLIAAVRDALDAVPAGAAPGSPSFS